jgi:hypothetical protein
MEHEMGGERAFGYALQCLVAQFGGRLFTAKDVRRCADPALRAAMLACLPSRVSNIAWLRKYCGESSGGLRLVRVFTGRQNVEFCVEHEVPHD